MKIIAQQTKKKSSQKNNLDKWADKKMSANAVSDVLHRLGYKSRSFRMSHCADEISSKVCPNGCHHKVFNASLCRDRLCPVCQWRRSRALATKTTTAVISSGFRVLAVTLTSKNCSSGELSGTIKKLSRAFSKMMRVARLKFVKGYTRSIEITHNKSDDTWHVHIHALWAVDTTYFSKGCADWITHDELCVVWAQALGVNYQPWCYVQAVRSGGEFDAVREICKYITKGNEVLKWDDDVLLEYIKSVHGVRLYSSAGCLKVSDYEIDDGMISAKENAEQPTCPACGEKLIDKTFLYNSGKYSEYNTDSYVSHSGENIKNIYANVVNITIVRQF